jgi:hypothetical protein
MEVSMPQLPEYPNFEHLKKQAKDLLRLYQANDREAFDRFRHALPSAANKDDAAIAALELKLHDAQSCIAREYGFPSWKNLRNYVDWSNSRLSIDRKDVIALWLHKAYGHDTEHADPSFAAKRLQEIPDFVQVISFSHAPSAMKRPSVRLLLQTARVRIACARTGDVQDANNTWTCRRYSQSRIRRCCAFRTFAIACIAAHGCYWMRERIPINPGRPEVANLL